MNTRIATVFAVLTAIVLLLTADRQVFDTNFYTLWEATALLAGDHPYRDFYEWGVPLQAALSAAAQLAVGYRLLGEFLLHWGFIIAGLVTAVVLALRTSHRTVAAAAMLFPVVLLAATATFHYPKLFFYPVAILASWRYLEQPNARQGALLGVLTAVAFLFRHDHGVYIGGLSVLTFAVTALLQRRTHHVRSMATHAAAYTAAVVLLLGPWAALVQSGEGLAEYVRHRAYLYQAWSADRSEYGALLTANPLSLFARPPLPAARPALVRLEWRGAVDAATIATLEERHRLRRRSEPDASGLVRYEVPNVYDPSLLELRSFINDNDGFEWATLRAATAWLPQPETAGRWLAQVTLLVPLLALLKAGVILFRDVRRSEPVRVSVVSVAVAAIFLAVIENRLLREASYFLVLAPLTAALAAWLLAGPPVIISRRAGAAVGVLAVMFAVVTAAAVIAYTRDSRVFRPGEWDELRRAYRQIMASPPIDGYIGKNPFRYIHECTEPGDRVLVTGSTPYDAGYYMNRQIAGGQVFWHHGWRADPAGDKQARALLEQQSVPFALSTTDPVLDDLKRYPQVLDYVQRHYVEVEGGRGRLLVDSRRQPRGTFGESGWPCFR